MAGKHTGLLSSNHNAISRAVNALFSNFVSLRVCTSVEEYLRKPAGLDDFYCTRPLAIDLATPLIAPPGSRATEPAHRCDVNRKAKSRLPSQAVED